jgi:hypothetical protein
VIMDGLRGAPAAIRRGIVLPGMATAREETETMRPLDGRVWRKDGRRLQRRAAEPQLRATPTRRQVARQLVRDAEDMLARQAHIDAAWDLPFLIAGLPRVTVLTLGDDDCE